MKRNQNHSITAMKPKTTVVMRDMIQQIRATFPFAMSEQELCAETCSFGCSIKLLAYMDIELCEWEKRLGDGEIPNFGDIQKLAQSSRKIYKILEKNHLVGETVSRKTAL